MRLTFDSVALQALPKRDRRDRLIAMMERVFEGPCQGEGAAPVQWANSVVSGICAPLGLARGAVHEWFLVVEGGGRGAWDAPLTLLTAAARVAAARMGLVAWIGRRVWPYPPILGDLLSRSLFVDAAGEEERVWAAEVALRSHGVGAVVVDGSRLDMGETRRLQLGAASGRRGEEGGAVGLVARPAWERGELSASQTRWLVRPAPSPTGDPRWTVELLRCKGLRPDAGGARVWTVQHSHETGDVGVVSSLERGPGAAEAQEARRSA